MQGFINNQISKEYGEISIVANMKRNQNPRDLLDRIWRKQQGEQDCYFGQIMQGPHADPQFANVDEQEACNGYKGADIVPTEDGDKQPRGLLPFVEVRIFGGKMAKAYGQAYSDQKADNGKDRDRVDDFHVPAFW